MLMQAGLLARIKRFLDGMGADERIHSPGVVLVADERAIDDGEYGDPLTVDNRPDFVKADEVGWTPLRGSFRR